MAHCFVTQNQNPQAHELTTSGFYHQIHSASSLMCSCCNEQQNSNDCNTRRQDHQQQSHNISQSNELLDDLAKLNDHQFAAYESTARQESDYSRNQLTASLSSSSSSSSSPAGSSPASSINHKTTSQQIAKSDSNLIQLEQLREETTMRNPQIEQYSDVSGYTDHNQDGNANHSHDLFGSNDWNMISFRSSNELDIQTESHVQGHHELMVENQSEQARKPIPANSESNHDYFTRNNSDHERQTSLNATATAPTTTTTSASENSYCYLGQATLKSPQTASTKSLTDNNNMITNDFNNNNNNNQQQQQQQQQQEQLSFANLTPISNELYYNNNLNGPSNFNQHYEYGHQTTTIEHYPKDTRHDLSSGNQYVYSNSDNQLVLMTNLHGSNDYHESRSSRNSAASSPQQTTVCSSHSNNSEYAYYQSANTKFRDQQPYQNQYHHHHHNQQRHNTGAQNHIQDQQNQYQLGDQRLNDSSDNNNSLQTAHLQSNGMLDNSHSENQFKCSDNNYLTYHHNHLDQNQHHTVHHYANNLISATTTSDSININKHLQVSSDNVVGQPTLKSKIQKVRSRRGRPRKKSGHSKSKLWEFIRDLLLNEHTNPSFIRWERHEDGVFKFVQSDKVAKMWGERKQNPKMTYEKLSRAMRYYYKSKVLLPVFGRRLVYKFGPNATGWLNSATAANN